MSNPSRIVLTIGIGGQDDSFLAHPLLAEGQRVIAAEDSNAHDALCHEHLEYDTLRQVRWMLDRIGFALVEFNDVDGGGFPVTASSAAGTVDSPPVTAVVSKEAAAGLDVAATPVFRWSRLQAVDRGRN